MPLGKNARTKKERDEGVAKHSRAAKGGGIFDRFECG